jgi:polyhydroxyalkanoate synthesis regulator phasin
MSEEKKGAKDKVSDGIKQGIGVLSAFKEALEETIQEAKERGDLSTERAREVMKGALEKAHAAAEDARERLDFATQNELDGLKGTVDTIKERVSALEVHLGFGRGDAEAGGGAEAERSGSDSATDDDGEQGESTEEASE